MDGLSKAYIPREVEGPIYERWLAADVFAPDGAGSTADSASPTFTIIQPPPNVTGSLGHAQRTTVEDLMVRHARMRGQEARPPVAGDHASIAAQSSSTASSRRRRERPVAGRGLERMRAFSDSTQLSMHARPAAAGRRLVHWGRLRYTMDDGFGRRRPRGLRAALLRRPGLSHRGARQLVPGLPDQRKRPGGRVHPRERDASLVGPLYPIDETTGQPDPEATITVATTPARQLILGDTAVAVHPDDARYRELVGVVVRIPFVERDVPTMADAVVDPAFGTGAVKITRGHDHDDHETRGSAYGPPAPVRRRRQRSPIPTRPRRPGPL